MALARRSVVVALAGLLGACSGAGHDEFFEPGTEQAETSATSPAPAEPDSSAAPSPNAPPGSSPPATPGPGPAPPSPPSAPEACTQESEPNDLAVGATTFTTRFCGKIDRAGDVDWARFTLPAGTTKVSWSHEDSGGKVTVRFFLGGVPLGDQNDGELRVVPGATYSVQIRAAQGNRPQYELEIAIQK